MIRNDIKMSKILIKGFVKENKKQFNQNTYQLQLKSLT